MGIIGILLLAVILIFLITCVITVIIYRIQFGKRVNAKIFDIKQIELKRKKVEFFSDCNRLTGYYYWNNQKELSKDKIILFIHGHGLTHSDYLLEISEFVHRGYSVFAYDMTGCGESEGKALKGFAQFVIDAESAVLYLKKEAVKEIVVFGHSTGAYAAAALLNIQNSNVNKAITVSAFDIPDRFVRGSMQKSMKLIAYLIQFWLKIFERVQFGNYASLSGKEGIIKFHNKVLIIQGDKDQQVPLEESLYNLKEELDHKQVEFLLVKDVGHYPTRLENANGDEPNKVVFDTIEKFIGGKNERIY